MCPDGGHTAARTAVRLPAKCGWNT